MQASCSVGSCGAFSRCASVAREGVGELNRFVTGSAEAEELAAGCSRSSASSSRTWRDAVGPAVSHWTEVKEGGATGRSAFVARGTRERDRRGQRVTELRRRELLEDGGHVCCCVLWVEVLGLSGAGSWRCRLGVMCVCAGLGACARSRSLQRMPFRQRPFVRHNCEWAGCSSTNFNPLVRILNCHSHTVSVPVLYCRKVPTGRVVQCAVHLFRGRAPLALPNRRSTTDNHNHNTLKVNEYT